MAEENGLPGQEDITRQMQDADCIPNPWESLRRDQLTQVNKAADKKEQLEKGTEGGGKILACC
jgi:hypothetical protein